MIFVFDECVSSKFAEALKILGKDTHSYKDYWEPGCPDEEWIPVASAKGWVILTSDHLYPHRRLALRQDNGRIFLLAMKDLPAWEQFRLLVEKWNEIEKVAEKSKPPFIYRVPKRGALTQVIL
jgi:predicted nuclease of predicted toxin-antitoxin system